MEKLHKGENILGRDENVRPETSTIDGRPVENLDLTEVFYWSTSTTEVFYWSTSTTELTVLLLVNVDH